MEQKYILYLIRRYHSFLLGYANRLVRMKASLQDSDFMPFLWRYEVAQMIKGNQEESKKLAQTIKKLREEYDCVDF